MSEREPTGDSRRSFMAKSALATGALTLGTSAFGTATVGAQDEQVAVFANNFYPGADFSVIAQLPTSATVEILQREGETVSEISQPDEWAGHIVRYDIGQLAGITTFMFVRGQGLSGGDTGSLGESASVLSSDLNLLNTSLGSGSETSDSETVQEDPVEENTTEETENETAANGGD